MEERTASHETARGNGSARAVGHRGPERLEAFSDGVFAIAITLLVLEIRIPPPEVLAHPEALVLALGDLWPSYLGYVVSFVTVGIMWANHHNLIRLVATVSHGLMLANLLLLLGVGFIPFPTALLAATLGTPSAQIGVLVYAGASSGWRSPSMSSGTRSAGAGASCGRISTPGRSPPSRGVTGLAHPASWLASWGP